MFIVKKMYFNNVGYIKASGILKVLEFESYLFVISETRHSSNSIKIWMKKIFQPLDGDKKKLLTRINRLGISHLQYSAKYGVFVSDNFFENCNYQFYFIF